MGGKRKSTKPPPKKKKATLPKTFKCPYCSHDGACEVQLNRAAETGSISCRICGENFQCVITYLSDPIDVYCEWIDACDAARGGAGDARAAASAPTSTATATAVAAGVTTADARADAGDDE